MNREKPVRCSAVLRSACALAGLVAFLAAPGSAGAANRTVPIAVSPGSATELASSPTACPPFSWTLLPEAREYELVVVELPAARDGTQPDEPLALHGFDEPGEVVLRRRVPGGANHWLPSRSECLGPARDFAWAVRARLDDGWGSWSEPLLLSAPGAPLVAVPAPTPTGEGTQPMPALAPKSSHDPAIVADGVIESTSGGFRFPDGLTQSKAFRLTVLYAAVDANGTKLHGNVATSSKDDTGDYLVDLGRPAVGCSATVTPGVYNPPTDTAYILPNGSASAVLSPSSSTINVRTWTSTGGAFDFPFFLVAVCGQLNFGF